MQKRKVDRCSGEMREIKVGGEGDFLVCHWRLRRESMGSKHRIRYPGSPRRKRWSSVRGFPPFSAEVNALSTPPGESAARLKLKGIDGCRTAVEHVV